MLSPHFAPLPFPGLEVSRSAPAIKATSETSTASHSTDDHERKSTTMNPPKLETIFVAVCFLLVTSGFQTTSAAAAGNSQAKLDRARFVRRVAEVEVRPVEHYSRVLIQLLWECTENTSFSSYLTNGPNKLDCLSRTSPYDLVKCNTLTYWAYS